MKVPRVIGEWLVIGLLSSSFILVFKWLTLSTGLKNATGVLAGLPKVAGLL